MKINRRTPDALLAKVRKLAERLRKEKHPRPLWNVKGEWPTLKPVRAGITETKADAARRRRIRAGQARERQLIRWQRDLRNLLPVIANYLSHAGNAIHYQQFAALRLVSAASHADMRRQDLISHATTANDLATAAKLIEAAQKEPQK